MVASLTILLEKSVIAFSCISKSLVRGSQVKVSEVRFKYLKVLEFHWSRVGFHTLSNEITPCKSRGRRIVHVGELGSGKVSACICSVGSAAKNLGRSLMVMSFTRHCIGQCVLPGE